MSDRLEPLHPHMREHEKLEKDPHASERVCGNDVCGCVLHKPPPVMYCSEYCEGEGDRAEGKCECGHLACT